MTLKLNTITQKYECVWHFTKLPEEFCNSIENDLNKYISEDSLRYGTVGSDNVLNEKIRKNKICFFDDNHWVAAFIHFYIMKSNEENFNYDITSFQDNCLQYTSYEEGEYYNWHVDGSVISPTGKQRKLSFSLQLSDPSEYEGGDLQFLDVEQNSMFFAPKERGTLIIFDSRIKHRVKKIKKGKRKSIVGWIEGPRWK
jgi:PKHD-type hydroxylase